MTQDPATIGGDYKERIEIFLSCQDLVSKDMFSKTDAFVVVSLKNAKTGNFEEIGRTETIKDEYNPSFAKSFVIDFSFEEEQELRFDVYDQDKDNTKNLKGQDFIGCCNMTLGELMHASGQQMTRMLLHKGKSVKNAKAKMCSRFTARVESVTKTGHEEIVITFGGEHLASMDFFGKSDPFLEIYRMTDTQPLLVCRTEKIDNTEKPVWKPITVSSQELCNSDPDRPLLLRVLDWDSNGSHELIGEVKTTLNALRKNFNVELENGKKKGKKVGSLKVVEFRSTPFFSFLDYVIGGVDLSLMIAIDFTASNGKPSHPQSLHHLSAQGTQYQLAIRTIANVVSCYDSDQRFPVWGFGGKAPHGDVMHVFPLNGDDSNPEVHGVYGIEEAYLNALTKVELFGPTLFYPILKKAVTLAEMAHSNVKHKIKYYTLLILTDGVIEDFQETKDLLVMAANKYLPLSVIIVGVGIADFYLMKQLDADSGALQASNGQTAKRDIVQFVSFQDYSRILTNEKGEPIGLAETNFAQLSRETLKEVPLQFMSYANFHQLTPPKRTTAKDMDSDFTIHEPEIPKMETSSTHLDERPTGIHKFHHAVEPPLPPGWKKAYDVDGTPYYLDYNNKTTQWEHPCARKNTMSSTTEKEYGVNAQSQQTKTHQASQWTTF